VENLERELKELIVQSLELSDVSADDIDSEAPLFGEGLGLDSIDALELAVALNKSFSVNLRSDDEETKQVFASVRNLAAYIERQRAASGS
jgi:acyl carrier protein